MPQTEEVKERIETPEKSQKSHARPLELRAAIKQSLKDKVGKV
jgi:hypothetical protein